MFQITIFFLYIIAGISYALSRLPRFATSSALLLPFAFVIATAGLIWHAVVLFGSILTPAGMVLSIGNSASIIGLQLALIAVLGATDPRLRGLAGGLLILGGIAAFFTATSRPGASSDITAWQLQAHILISLFAYGLLSVGAIVAVFALVQDARLRAGRITAVNQLFAPLETNERLLYGIAATGFSALLLGVLSGLTFVDNMFAQHLVHKTTLSILALVLFGVLLAGRHLAGWRGRPAVYLYLCGFGTLGLAYFGSRYVLEALLQRSWG